MLKDLLNEFTEHKSQYPEFDINTMVLENYVLKTGLYIRINNDNSIDELYVTKKTEIPINDDLVEWFKKNDFYSSLIEMNKTVDPKKQIHSNNIYSLFCKIEVFIQNGKENPVLREHVDRYFNALTIFKDESKKILTAAGYKPLLKETVQSNRDRLTGSFDEVIKRIKQHDIRENCYIKLFLNVREEFYMHESGRYLLPKIFNNNKYNVSIEGNVLGLSNTDMGMNEKKPYLEHKTTPFKVPYRITTEEAVLLRKLYLWLNGQTRERKALYNGYVPIGNHDPQLFAVANEMDERKPVIYLHFERGIGLTVDDSDYLPSFSDRLSKPVIFTNYLDATNYNGGKLTKLSSVEAHINENLYALQLVRNYYVEHLKVTKKLTQPLADQIMLTRDAMRAWLRKGDVLPIKNNIDQATMGVIIARLKKLEYVPALAHALNVRFSLLKYFGGEERDMGASLETAYLELKEKVINRRNTVNCQNALEFHLAVGQLIRYFFRLSEAQSVNYDELWRSIMGAKNIEDIKKEYRRLFQRYAYKININNPRFNNMITVASSYKPQQDEPVNLDALLYGFAADNIILFKEKGEN